MSLVDSLTTTPERRVALIMGGLLVVVLIGFGLIQVLNRVQSRSAALQEISEQIRNRVESIPPGNPRTRTDPLKRPVLISRLYEQRGFRPVWTNGREWLGRTTRFINLVRRVQSEGLNPGDYHLEQLDGLIDSLRRLRRNGENPDPRSFTELEILLTDALIQLASHRAYGRLDPRTHEPVRLSSIQQQFLVETITRALEENNLFHALEKLLPSSPTYRRLVEALQQYRSIRDAGGWPTLPQNLLLRKGDSGRRVKLLNQRLIDEGWLEPPEASVSDQFDTRVDGAVRRFQRQHGLTVDGIVGGRTVGALNVSAARRVRQITLNLERWRWLNVNSGDHYIQVNIADFRLQVVVNNEPNLTMRVVVGRPYRSTPVFSDRIHYLVFNPSWNVPETILAEDLLPRIRDDPRYLTRNNYRVLAGWGPEVEEVDPLTVDWNRFGRDGNFPYRIRQDPGPSNALGRVKFMFPNPHSVYLHDTPHDEAFREDRRDFSSGCIRIENPLDLAMHLLEKNKEWTRDRVRELLEEGTERTVVLKRKIPIHITYWTAWVDTNGRLQFRPDIYERDPGLEEALALD